MVKRAMHSSKFRDAGRSMHILTDFRFKAMSSPITFSTISHDVLPECARHATLSCLIYCDCLLDGQVRRLGTRYSAFLLSLSSSLCIMSYD
mmetsp:Transcript_18927/g.57182  ORF Transcript_18927/g.57182 Transcript_18927/m.57182 type:complete len:91 (-) Transcript_18927:229-501(-)